MAESEMITFCFHSVRPVLAIPPASAWPSEELHKQMVDFLHVDPEWYYDWVSKACAHWGPDQFTVTFDDAFRDVLLPAVWTKQKFKVRTIVFVPTAHIGQLFPFAPYDVMGGQELAYLAGQGVELGSHGHQHRDMHRMPRGVIGSSLFITKEILSSLSPNPITTLAPPHGHFDETLMEEAKKLGFTEVYGTSMYPAGKFGSLVRFSANMDGFVDEVLGQNKPVFNQWPWEA